MSIRTNIGSNQPPTAVTDKALNQLVDLAKVSNQYRQSFLEDVRGHVSNACDLQQLERGLSESSRETVYGAASNLHDALKKLKPNERQLLAGVLLPDELSDLQSTAYQLADVFSLLTGRSAPHPSTKNSKSRSRGRRAGSPEKPILRRFIWELLVSTKESGGRLTVEKNIQRGTLLDAIELLSDVLPGLRSLSVSTLQRCLNEANRSRQAAADLDSELP